MWHWSQSPHALKMLCNLTLFEATDWPVSVNLPSYPSWSVIAINSVTKPILLTAEKQPGLACLNQACCNTSNLPRCIINTPRADTNSYRTSTACFWSLQLGNMGHLLPILRYSTCSHCLPTPISVPSVVTLNESVWFRFCRMPVMRSNMKQIQSIAKHRFFFSGLSEALHQFQIVSVIAHMVRYGGKCP